MIYFDTTYLARLYLEESGSEKVRALAAANRVACGLHGRAETSAAFHRKFREGFFNAADCRDTLEQFERDCNANAITWLPLSVAVIARVTKAYSNLAKTIGLRAADAIHLACAAENRFREIYTNDQRLLAAARHFGLQGVNVI